MCAFGTFTCGEIGIGPKSLLAAVVLRIIESAVVEELLKVVWYTDEVDENDVDSEGEMALLLKSIAADPVVVPVGCIFGLDGKIGELSHDERLLRALLAEVKSQF